MLRADAGSPRRSRARTWQMLDRGQRRSLIVMVTVVAGLHVVGFLALVMLVAPHR